MAVRLLPRIATVSPSAMSSSDPGGHGSAMTRGSPASGLERGQHHRRLDARGQHDGVGLDGLSAGERDPDAGALGADSLGDGPDVAQAAG